MFKNGEVKVVRIESEEEWIFARKMFVVTRRTGQILRLLIWRLGGRGPIGLLFLVEDATTMDEDEACGLSILVEACDWRCFKKVVDLKYHPTRITNQN